MKSLRHLVICIGVAALLRAAEGTNTSSHGSPAVYDYIVVGSGPGGSPLAARLALAGEKVLLIDAGDDQGDSLFAQVPGYASSCTGFDNIKWDYFVDHWSNTSQADKDTKLVWQSPDGSQVVGPNAPPGSQRLGVWYPRAGTLGGCSQHHALVTVYPHRSDWDGIAQLTGDASWNADNMRKYFEKIERLHYSPTKMSGHGTNGWLSTTLPSSKLVASDSQILGLIRSALNLFGGKVKGPIKSSIGLETAIDRDINSNSRSRDTKEGVFQHPNSVTSGRRHGPREFVLSVAGVKNKNGTRRYHLDIQLNTLVTKVRFQHDEDGTHRAVGVDYLVGRSLYKADPRASEKQTGRPGHAIARKEVILSAGTFNTPQLLKLSGIGPRQELEAHGINTVVDLPGVGTNLQDRYEVTVIGETPSNLTFWDTCKLGSPDDPCVQRWKAAVAANDPTVELNPLAQSSFVMTMIKKSSQALTDPDLIIGGATLPFRGYYPDFPRDSCHRRRFTMVILKGHTNNRAGTVTLRSNNPRDVPKIEFRYFDEGTTYDESGASADMRDLDAVVEGVRFAREVFAGVEGTEFKGVWPGENITTTEDLRKFVRDEAWGHHASCSCPIGPDTDPMAVLESKFRVRGVKGLRVVDASVFPKIPGFFIIVPIYMISEKAADVILGGV